MRTAAEIENRVRFLLVDELNFRVKQASFRLPTMCVHNYRHPLDVRKTVDGETNPNYNRIRLPVASTQTIGLCMLLDPEGKPLPKPDPEHWGGTICEDPIDAQRCQYFTPTDTKETILTEFKGQLSNLEWVRANMPEVYALLWVLERTVVPSVPWWKQLLYWFLRIEPDPIRIVMDPGKLLGE